MERHACCVTGHRPRGFLWNYYNASLPPQLKYLNAMRKEVLALIESGRTDFLAGGALGVDTDFAETVLNFRDIKYPDLHLEIAVPCPDQEKHWALKDQDRYRKILQGANTVTAVSPHYTNYCMQKRNRYMVDASDVVLAFWNGEERGGTYNTILYATKQKKPVKIVLLTDFL